MPVLEPIGTISMQPAGAFSDGRHLEITDRLEAAKASGEITDFFVSWSGMDGRLDPTVRAWRSALVAEDHVRDRLAYLLKGLVDPQRLIIFEDGRSEA
jgi:hypothetical protein